MGTIRRPLTSHKQGIAAASLSTRDRSLVYETDITECVQHCTIFDVIDRDRAGRLRLSNWRARVVRRVAGSFL